jgi:glyoxylase-like metal-dependent hydrolase (beta-lactamase superfamily II)
MAGNYQVDVLIQGFPGRAVCHGGLGWSTVTLLRGGGRAILVDVGAFGVRKELRKQLKACGVEPDAITDVVISHAHYDHAVNFTLFPNATAWIGREELEWAARQPPGFNPLPELYVQELARSPRVRRVEYGETFLPGLQALKSAGHTPGHLLFYLTQNDVPILFTGDSAKNRAELLSRTAADTHDEEATRVTMETIWSYWRAKPGTLVIPGHDMTMRLDENGLPAYVGERKAAISAWFGEDLAMTTEIDLCGKH